MYLSCNIKNVKYLLIGILALELFIVMFNIFLIQFTDYFILKREIKDIILSETPIYNLHFSTKRPSKEFKYIESFHKFKGREIVSVSTDRNGHSTVTKRIVGEKNISKIYQAFFIYNADKRTYIDYKRNYSVAPGEKCKKEYKKCGILNNKGRILCLHYEEECPLNDFAISDKDNDQAYNGYDKFEVLDSISKAKRYFYYTNKKTDNQIITEFKLSYGIPCMVSTENSWISIFKDEVDKNPDCKTLIDGKNRDYRYIEVPGSNLSLKSLYNDNYINFQSGDLIKNDENVHLYMRNFYDKDEECINNFLKHFEYEEALYINIEYTIKISFIVSILLNIAFAIYLITRYYYHLKFYLFLFIVPIYGILLNLILIIVLNCKRHEYKCDEIGFNSKINYIINKNDLEDYSLTVFIIIISIIFQIIVLIFSVIMKNINLDPSDKLASLVEMDVIPVNMNQI